MKKVLFLVGLISILAALTGAVAWPQTIQASSLPNVVYLGDSGTHSIPSGEQFIVKRLSPFRFDSVGGSSYTIQSRERLWQSTTSAPPAIYHATVELGYAPPGCWVRYVAIDDDVDDRINHFYQNGVVVHTMSQGMVVEGQFYLDTGGNLTMVADDSIGMWAEVCEEVVPPTPPPTNTATPTLVPTATPTEPVPTATPTSTGTVTPAPPTPTATATLPPTMTPTGTPEPSATPTPPGSTPLPPRPTPSITPTPTKEPRLNACLRINFEVAADEATRGLYVVQEVGGRVLFEWYALDGWQDSGWVDEIDITYPSVYVQVLYYSGPDTTPVVMKILNPAPGTEYGWLSRGMCHAIEVGWP